MRIEGAYSTLRTAEQRVADFILKHPDELIYLTVTELAETDEYQRIDGRAAVPEDRLQRLSGV